MLIVYYVKYLSELYIPHGSDERSETVKAYNQKQRFISHMVQMKVPPILELPGCFVLYIPHGSDESPTGNNFTFAMFDTLYPTWFR